MTVTFGTNTSSSHTYPLRDSSLDTNESINAHLYLSTGWGHGV